MDMIAVIDNLQAIGDELQARANELRDNPSVSAPEQLRKLSELNGQRVMYTRIVSMILAEHNKSLMK